MRAVAKPSLSEILACFLRIGAMSFGGAVAALIHRQVVEARGWIDDRDYASGFALAQLAPGAGAFNIAIYVGTRLRGAAGAFVAFIGLLLVPAVTVLTLGALYLVYAAALPIAGALAGVGAAAIGLTLATAERMRSRNVRGLGQLAVVLITAACVGVFGLNFFVVLAVMLPVSWLIAGGERR